MTKRTTSRRAGNHPEPTPPKGGQAPDAATPARGPHVIVPTAVYLLAEAQAALKLRTSTVRREVREGRLRISKRAGRYYLLGEWILEWLRGGELPRRRRAQPEANGVGHHEPGSDGH